MIRKLLEKFARGLLALVAEPEPEFEEPPCCGENCCRQPVEEMPDDPKEHANRLREIADKLDPPPAAPSTERLEELRRISLELRKASAEKASPEEMSRFAKACAASKPAKVRRNI